MILTIVSFQRYEEEIRKTTKKINMHFSLSEWIDIKLDIWAKFALLFFGRFIEMRSAIKESSQIMSFYLKHHGFFRSK